MRRCATVALLAAVVAGCGAADARPPGVAAVIRAWADDVREGRFAAAGRRFALPATIANGGPPQRVESAAELDAFNRGLSCGAVVTSTRDIDDGRTLATFRLTDRHGSPGSCGSGAGAEAQVTFRVRDGRIVEWLRVADAPPGAIEV